MRKEILRRGELAMTGIAVSLVLLAITAMPVSAALSSPVITDVRPSVLHPGDTTEVTLTVKNNGVRDARDVRLEFKVSDRQNISIVGSTVVQIPYLDSWSEKKAKVKVHVADGVHAGVYTIPVTYSWDECHYDPSGGYICLPSTYVYDPKTGVGFQVREPVSEVTFIVKGAPKLGLGEVYTEPVHIRPGDEKVKITVVIWNIGDADMKDINVRLECKDQFKASWSDADRAYRAGLKAEMGFSAIFHLDIMANAEPGIYTLPLIITYHDVENREHREEKEIELRVEGNPKLTLVSYSTDPEKVTAGDHPTLYLRIENVGSEAAIDARIQPRTPFKFDMESYYVGNLGIKETREVIMGFNVDAETPQGIYQQVMELQCTNRDNDTLSSVEYIPLEVFPKLMNVSSPPTNNISSSNNNTPAAPGNHSPSRSPMTGGFYALMALIAIGLLSALYIIRGRMNR